MIRSIDRSNNKQQTKATTNQTESSYLFFKNYERFGGWGDGFLIQVEADPNGCHVPSKLDFFKFGCMETPTNMSVCMYVRRPPKLAFSKKFF
jgi:hypothetical protein